MEPEDHDEYVRFTSTFVPLIQRLDKTTRELLFPALDGCPVAFIVRESEPITIPTPLIVLDVNVSEKLCAAMAECRAMINEFIAAMRKHDPSLSPFELEAPVHRAVAGGTLFSYPVPPFIPGFEPHAWLKGNRVIQSLFPEQTTQLLAAKSSAADRRVIDVTGAAGAVTQVFLERFTKLIARDAEPILNAMAARHELQSRLAFMIASQVPLVRDLLGTLKHYQSRTYIEGDYRVQHSWLEVVDADTQAAHDATPDGK